MSNILIPCNNCHKTNRIKSEKLNSHPKCGSCGNEIKIIDKPVYITSSNFQNEVIKYPGWVLLDFWAEWCGPCRMISPVLEQIAKEKAGFIKIGKINTEKEQSLASQFGIRSIPTLILYNKGKIVDQVSGALPKQQLEEWIRQKQSLSV